MIKKNILIKMDEYFLKMINTLKVFGGFDRVKNAIIEGLDPIASFICSEYFPDRKLMDFNNLFRDCDNLVRYIRQNNIS